MRPMMRDVGGFQLSDASFRGHFFDATDRLSAFRKGMHGRTLDNVQFAHGNSSAFDPVKGVISS